MTTRQGLRLYILSSVNVSKTKMSKEMCCVISDCGRSPAQQVYFERNGGSLAWVVHLKPGLKSHVKLWGRAHRDADEEESRSRAGRVCEEQRKFPVTTVCI